MVKRYKKETKANDVPPHVSMGFNNTWIFLSDVLPRAIKKHGGHRSPRPCARPRWKPTFRSAARSRATA